MYGFKLFSIWGITFWFLATMDRYNSWLNHYLEFLSYEYFIYRLYLDITVLYSCIYFLHNVVLFNNYFILLFSFKKYISVFFSHFSTWAYVWHNLSIPFLFFFLEPSFLYTNLVFWVRLNSFLCCSTLLLNWISFSPGPVTHTTPIKP